LDFYHGLEFLGIRNILSLSDEYIKYMGYFCNKFTTICKFIVKLYIETEPTEQIEWSNILKLFYYSVGGTSNKNMIHWTQILDNETPQYYCYGEEKNLQVYNSTTAPYYKYEELEKMKIDVFITSSNKDPYCTTEDLQRMLQTFKSSKVTVEHVSEYNHVDYLWGKNAHIDLYPKILNFLDDI
jgi:hypothetical protein